MLMMLRRMGRGDLTAHGFRSTFRDWTAERTNFPREVAEAALAHVVGDKWRPLIGVVICSRNGAVSWMRGRRTVSSRLSDQAWWSR
jgi:hypothetical protein